MKNLTLPIVFAVVTLSVAMPAANAATLTDFTLASEIDVTGQAQDVDFEATGATPEATLEVRTDLNVIQDMRQSSVPGSFVNTFVFTDTSLPDIRTEFTSNGRNGSAGSPTGSSGGTSPGEALRFIGNSNSSDIVFDIDFGSFDTGTSTFNSAVNPVEAAGFTFSNLRDNTTFTVQFFNNTGGLLSTQTATGLVATGGDLSDVYFGFQSVADPIGLITVTRSISSGDQAFDTDFGDLAFTGAVPEPTTFAMLLGGLGLLALRRRR